MICVAENSSPGMTPAMMSTVAVEAVGGVVQGVRERWWT